MSQAGILNVGGSTPGVLDQLTGNSGTAVADVSHNINLVTANTTVKFVGAVSTITQDFGGTNLLLGDNGAAIAGASQNVGVGQLALGSLTSGILNTTIGSAAGRFITSGGENTLIGADTGSGLSTGSGNTILGENAFTVSNGSNNIVIGAGAGSQPGSSNILIGVDGPAFENNAIRIGTEGSGAGQQNATYIAGIQSNALTGQAVVITASGQLGVGGAPTTWTDKAGSFAAAVNNGYFISAAATATLPAAPTQGQFVIIETATASSVVIRANTGQVIRMGSGVSSVAGTATSSAAGNSVYLVYRAANTSWYSISTEGTWLLA